MSFSKTEIQKVNPAVIEWSFNASVDPADDGDSFVSYNRAEKQKGEPVKFTKKKPFRLVVLNHAKRFAGGKREGETFKFCSSSFFTDYDNHVIRLYGKEGLIVQGLYADIKEDLKDAGAKAQMIYFCYDRDSGDIVMLQGKGSMKYDLHNEWKKVGGYDAAPVLNLWNGKNLFIEKDPETGRKKKGTISFYKVMFEMFPADTLSSEETQACIEGDVSVKEYLADVLKNAVMQTAVALPEPELDDPEEDTEEMEESLAEGGEDGEIGMFGTSFEDE